jgi:hypothetical protein
VMAEPLSIFREHLDQLARAHGIRLTFVEPDPARGWLARSHPAARPPRVEAPEPVDRRAYVAALHEFGHVLGDDGAWMGAMPLGGPPAAPRSTRRSWRGCGPSGTLGSLTPADGAAILEHVRRLAERAGATDGCGAELVPPFRRARYADAVQELELLSAGAARV